jgi:hypothetical protein
MLQQILVNIAFKVFNNRDKEAKQLKDKNICIKHQMLASILQRQMSHTSKKETTQKIQQITLQSLLPMWRPRALGKSLP